MEEFRLTKKEWKEFLAFKEEYQENETKRNLLLQKQNDILAGGIRSANLAEYRNTYVINAQDSLDADFPMYVHFNIISEMIKIVSVKVSFWILNYRAYSKAGKMVGGLSYIAIQIHNADGVDYVTLNTGYASAYKLFPVAGVWNLKEHVHPADYGIFEEETSPTIMPYISRDNGLTYGLPLGSYTKDRELDITRFIDTKGSKMIKFESSVRARLSVQITIKLDISAR